MNKEKFLNVKSVEFLQDDIDFGGNYGIFKVVLEKTEGLKKTELTCTINKAVGETFKKLGIINKKYVPMYYFKEDINE